jgi:hypothetical protein
MAITITEKLDTTGTEFQSASMQMKVEDNELQTRLLAIHNDGSIKLLEDGEWKDLK